MPNATRVVFTSSNSHNFAPKNIINFEDVNLPNAAGWTRYGQSKAGNILLATYIAHHYADDGILAFSLNPGAIRTELTRYYNGFIQWFFGPFLYPPWQGAITQLYAGTNPNLTKADSGKYYGPWAREITPRKGTQDPALADKLWDYLEKETAGKY